MTTQDFLEKYLVKRKNTNSLKWDALQERFGDSSLTAMWVADMEFKAPEAMLEAMHKRIEHGVFGYTLISDEYYQSVIEWHQNRHGYTLEKEWFRFSYGVVTTLYWLVNAFTQVNDSILILTPVYYPFYNAIRDNNRIIVRSELNPDETGRYHIDYDDVEKAIIENDIKMFIQCNPHNPVGRLWTEEELDKLATICQKHNVLIITDEIHQDIVLNNHKFTPAMTVKNAKHKDNLIILTSSSKTFNLACLLSSHIFIPNPKLRKTYDTYAKTVNQIEPNILGMVATQAAYTHGSEWLKGLLGVIEENYRHFSENLKKYCPQLVITPLEGTYLCWVDLRAYIKPDEIKAIIQDECGFAIDFGEWFSDQCKGFVRFNLATDPAIVHEATKRLIHCLNSKKK